MAKVVWTQHVGRVEYPCFYEGSGKNIRKVSHERGVELINAGEILVDRKLQIYLTLRYKNLKFTDALLVCDSKLVVDGNVLIPFVGESSLVEGSKELSRKRSDVNARRKAKLKKKA